MNLRDLPEFNRKYLEFGARFDYDEAFNAWWSDMEEGLQDLMGHEQTEWLRRFIRNDWELSPVALRIMDDSFFDLVRKERRNVVA